MDHELGPLGLFVFLYQFMFSSSPLVRFACVALAKAGLVVGPLPPSVRPSVHSSVKLYGYQVCVICNSKMFSFLFIQTLPNESSHIAEVHLLFCARFIFFLIFDEVELRLFSIRNAEGCLVCVI